MAEETLRIAVIGLGNMGGAIAHRLIERGHEVRAWSRSADKVAELARAQAVPAGSPAEAARGADLVITMVSDGAALEAVTAGRDGVLAADSPGTLVQMSTVASGDILALQARLPEGWRLLEAPVLGSVLEARTGKLKILAGGPVPLFAHTASRLGCLGEWSLVGELGCGSAAKLVANAALLGVVALLGESLTLAGSLGLSREQAFEVLATTPLAAQADRRRPAIEHNSFPPRFTLAMAHKDIGLALSSARLPLLEAVAQWLADAKDKGWATSDYTAILAHIAGVEPR